MSKVYVVCNYDRKVQEVFATEEGAVSWIEAETKIRCRVLDYAPTDRTVDVWQVNVGPAGEYKSGYYLEMREVRS